RFKQNEHYFEKVTIQAGGGLTHRKIRVRFLNKSNPNKVEKQPHFNKLVATDLRMVL
ncbi:MAG: hypothetical protein ACI9IT_002007, partial [Glaciecola sp.]